MINHNYILFKFLKMYANSNLKIGVEDGSQ